MKQAEYYSLEFIVAADSLEKNINGIDLEHNIVDSNFYHYYGKMLCSEQNYNEAVKQYLLTGNKEFKTNLDIRDPNLLDGLLKVYNQNKLFNTSQSKFKDKINNETDEVIKVLSIAQN